MYELFLLIFVILIAVYFYKSGQNSQSFLVEHCALTNQILHTKPTGEWSLTRVDGGNFRVIRVSDEFASAILWQPIYEKIDQEHIKDYPDEYDMLVLEVEFCDTKIGSQFSIPAGSYSEYIYAIAFHEIISKIKEEGYKVSLTSKRDGLNYLEFDVDENEDE